MSRNNLPHSDNENKIFIRFTPDASSRAAMEQLRPKEFQRLVKQDAQMISSHKIKKK